MNYAELGGRYDRLLLEIAALRTWLNVADDVGLIEAVSASIDRAFKNGKAATQPEVCICAAVKMGDLIIRGHRHDDCIRNLVNRGLDPRPIEQGFITSRNRFVDRKEAMKLQLAAGAKSAYSHDGELHGTILFSEDLY